MREFLKTCNGPLLYAWSCWRTVVQSYIQARLWQLGCAVVWSGFRAPVPTSPVSAAFCTICYAICCFYVTRQRQIVHSAISPNPNPHPKLETCESEIFVRIKSLIESAATIRIRIESRIESADSRLQLQC